MSKAHITEVAAAVSRRSVEIFGGFGFTWECDIHRRVKRAIADRELFGSSAAHRRRELELLDW
jgi:alkylation response protein AidB-like acyl-CoA dehydrogenase